MNSATRRSPSVSVNASRLLPTPELNVASLCLGSINNAFDQLDFAMWHSCESPKLGEPGDREQGAVCITHRHRIQDVGPAESPLQQAVSKPKGVPAQSTCRDCKSQRLPIQSEPMSTKSGCHSDCPRRYRRPSRSGTASASSPEHRPGRTSGSCSLLWRSSRPPRLPQATAAFLWPQSRRHRHGASPRFHLHRPADDGCGVPLSFPPER